MKKTLIFTQFAFIETFSNDLHQQCFFFFFLDGTVYYYRVSINIPKRGFFGENKVKGDHLCSFHLSETSLGMNAS